MSEIEQHPFRVLCIDGGGMRGIYSAAFLAELGRSFAKKRNLGSEGLDLGKAFDLIVGTSTGGLVAMALAHGTSPERMLELYRSEGRRIFPEKVPTKLGLGLLKQLWTRPALLRSGERALREALEEVFGDMTLGELYRERGVALSVPAVEMTNHHPWIFKTPHLTNSNRRDDDYRLADVGLATTAAPIFRSLAAIDNPNGAGHRVFADGGLFANSPVMVGLVDALAMATSGQPVHVFGLGTCKRSIGTVIGKEEAHLGLATWGFGSKALSLALDAQDNASWEVAKLLREHLQQDVSMVRFHMGSLPTEKHHLLDLDETGEEAATALVMQAGADVQQTLSLCSRLETKEGRIINSMLMDAPAYVDAMQPRDEENTR